MSVYKTLLFSAVSCLLLIATTQASADEQSVLDPPASTHLVTADKPYTLNPPAAVTRRYPFISSRNHLQPSLDANNMCYIEGDAGYARQNYFDNAQWQANAGVNVNNNSNVRGGFSGGIAAGYQINQRYAIEAGWFHLPSVNTNLGNLAAAYLKSSVTYLVVKYKLPAPALYHTRLFFKLGAAYRKANMPANSYVFTAGVVSRRDSDYIRPTFATGFDYVFNRNLLGVFQYFYFMGANNSFGIIAAPPQGGALSTVGANVFTLGLSYNFNV